MQYKQNHTMKNKCLDFLKNRTNRKWYNAVGLHIDEYSFYNIEYDYIELSTDDIERIKQALQDTDDDALADGGYKDEQDRQSQHEEAICSLGLYYDFQFAAGEHTSCLLKYVNLEDYIVYTAFGFHKDDNTECSILLDFEDSANLLMLAYENDSLTMADIKNKNEELYNKIKRICGNEIFEPNKWTKLVNEFKEYTK